MSDTLIYLDPGSELNLQDQIRQKLVDAILAGALPPGRRLPSSRQLAEELRVARNTVVLAYQQLISEGYLVSRERSGVYVNERIVRGRVGFGRGDSAAEGGAASSWRRRMKGGVAHPRRFRDLPNWQEYPYPFIDGQFDRSLFPVAEWRDAMRLALGAREIGEWSTGSGDADDPMLVEEIRTKILPRRGITARPDEILVTLGAEQALYVLVQLLADRTTTAAVEEPGNPELRNLLLQRGSRLHLQPIDQHGLLVDERLDGCELLYVTPSHQIPTAVTLGIERRHALVEKAAARDSLIIEDDLQCETDYASRQLPALRSLDRHNRVLYVGRLSGIFGPALRLGFMVAAPELIREARELRRLMVRHPPLNNQRAAAYFLSLGHYDALLMRLGRIFEERRTALRDALNHYLPSAILITPVDGGTTYWVRGPDDLDVDYLVREAARCGILVEPVAHYYAAGEHPQNCFRMGVTAVPAEHIRPAVARLAALIRDLSSGRQERLENARGERLTGETLRRTLSGATLLSQTVYGDPWKIELLADGRMLGTAGFANEDCDTGRWWVEQDTWCRKWERWAYGEPAALHAVLDGERIKWFNASHLLIDSALIRRAGTF